MEVRCRRPKAALQDEGAPAQFVCTFEPAAPPTRKCEFQRATSPGLDAAMLISSCDVLVWLGKNGGKAEDARVYNLVAHRLL